MTSQFMDFLYNLVEHLPEFMQPSVVAMLTIFIGYLVSKILAAVLQYALSVEDAPNDNGVLPVRLRFVRFCFWASWFFFILLGLSQYPTTAPVVKPLFNISNWRPSQEFLTSQVLIGLIAFIVFLSEQWIRDAYNQARRYWTSLFSFGEYESPSKVKKRVKYLAIVLGFMLVMIKPEMLGELPRFIAAIVLLIIGYIATSATQHTICSVVGASKPSESTIARIGGYMVLINFLLIVLAILMG